MKISVNWLKTLIDIDKSPQQIADLLTSSGLEVEGLETFESIKGGLKGLVVGQVTECVKHPDADRLSLTKVNIGSRQILSIVCGAPNVALNQKVIVATVGTTLYPIKGDSFEIKKSKIRGVLSEGMICAEDEIGLGISHDGIIVLADDSIIGLSAAEYFKIETDTILEIGLTPNRSDAASHLGVARDLAAILNTEEKTVAYQANPNGLNALPKSDSSKNISIDVLNFDACKRYSGIVISDITVKDSPTWLKNKLQSIGIRSINNVVDITNFVLHDLGQPIHAFDYDKINGQKVIVRTAALSEKFYTLDSVERELQTTDLLICDIKSPMCIAGVFGGLNSGVTEKTNSIFIESAYFDPGFIRKTAKHHALKTDASFRFERGADPDMVINALIRASNLIIEIAGGKIAMDILDMYPEKMSPHKVAFSYSNCNALIGKEIDRIVIKNIILSLGIQIESEGTDGLLLFVPRYKTDVTREVDLIEEVMRIYGYNNIDVSKSISYTAFNENKNHGLLIENKVSSALEGFGFNEIMSLSLTKESYYKIEDANVKVVNPLSNDLGVLRADMLFSGLEAISYNINRKNIDLKLFEIGKIYNHHPNESSPYQEKKQISLFITGNLFNENPYGLNEKTNFSFLKSTVEQVLKKCGITNFKFSESNYTHFEMGLIYLQNNSPLVELGLVSKSQLKKFDINQPVFYAVLNLDNLVKAGSNKNILFEEINKFPMVRRDLSLLIDKKIEFIDIQELAYATERKFLKEVNLFDIYEDEKLGDKKSYAVSFSLVNKEATLTEKQIDGVIEKLILNFKEKLGAELR
jgi:phenylalanyl-tRNA synthetase beta chain